MLRLAAILTGATLWLSASSPAAAQGIEPPPALTPIKLDDPRVAEAMTLYNKRSELSEHTRAAKLMWELAASHPKDLPTQMWCARTTYYCAHRYQDDTDTMKKIAGWGATCGKRLEAYTGVYNAELWAILAHFKAVAATSLIPPLGEIEKLTRTLEVIARKNPDKYGTYILLGAIFRELPGWPLSIGDDELSLKYLRTGQQLAPKHAELLLELAATYKAVDNEPQARIAYQTCIHEGTGAPDMTFETAEARRWAKKMLKELD